MYEQDTTLDSEQWDAELKGILDFKRLLPSEGCQQLGSLPIHLYTQTPQREARGRLQVPDCYSSPCFLFGKIMQPSFRTRFH